MGGLVLSQRQYDPVRGRGEACRALVAARVGWGFGSIRATRNADDTACELIPPKGRSKYQLALDECTIIIGGRVGSLRDGNQQDEARCVELAASCSITDAEGQAFLDLAYQRACSLVGLATQNRTLDRFLAVLQRHDGELDTSFAARQDVQPLVEVTPQITLNLSQPPSIINVTVPQPSPTPVVIENNLEQPDRLVTFHRDFSGAITEATIETETEPETTT